MRATELWGITIVENECFLVSAVPSVRRSTEVPVRRVVILVSHTRPFAHHHPDVASKSARATARANPPHSRGKCSQCSYSCMRVELFDIGGHIEIHRPTPDSPDSHGITRRLFASADPSSMVRGCIDMTF